MNEPALVKPPQVFRDKDIFHDQEGRVFIAHGFIQPVGRVISYLKYTPSETGRWQVRHQFYDRVFTGGSKDVLEGMARVPSDYLVDDSHFGTELLEVPQGAIAKYYNPELRLKEILKADSLDTLEKRAKEIAEVLHDTLGIPFDTMGVTGSIAWKAHNPSFSDINMNVYGLEMSNRLRLGYDAVIKENSHVRLRTVEEWTKGTIERLRTRVPSLTRDELTFLFQRRKELCIDDFYVGVMPVLLPDEAPIKHGTERYEQLTSEPIRVEMELEVTDYSSFTPAVFNVESSPLDTIRGERVTRVLVYDGAFKDLYLTGDRVEVSGILQRVTVSEGLEVFYQMMVGTKAGAGSGYIRVIHPSET